MADSIQNVGELNWHTFAGDWRSRSVWNRRDSSPVDVGLTLSNELDFPDTRTRRWLIEQSDIPPGEPYLVSMPISTIITRDNLDFVARWQEANIAIGGEHFRDAFQALVSEILDTFDYLSNHVNELGGGPARQLSLLRRHLAKIDQGSR